MGLTWRTIHRAIESERTNVSLSVIRRTFELDRVCPRTRKLLLKSRGWEKQLLSRCGSTEQDAKRKGMPTILRKDGLRFFFFSREGTEPPHVHVEQAERYAKFWLEPVVLLEESLDRKTLLRFQPNSLGSPPEYVAEKRVNHKSPKPICYKRLQLGQKSVRRISNKW